MKWKIVLITPTNRIFAWDGARWVTDHTKARAYLSLASATIAHSLLYKNKANFLPRCQVWVDFF